MGVVETMDTYQDIGYAGITIINYFILVCGVFTVITLNLEIEPRQQLCSYLFLAMIFCVPTFPLPMVTLVALTIVSKIITHVELSRLTNHIKN